MDKNPDISGYVSKAAGNLLTVYHKYKYILDHERKSNSVLSGNDLIKGPANDGFSIIWMLADNVSYISIKEINWGVKLDKVGKREVKSSGLYEEDDGSRVSGLCWETLNDHIFLTICCLVVNRKSYFQLLWCKYWHWNVFTKQWLYMLKQN